MLSSKQMNFLTSSQVSVQPPRMILEGCDRTCSEGCHPFPEMSFTRKPESPRAAYNIFADDKKIEIQRMKMSASTISRLNISALIGDWWKNITPSQRNHYTLLAEEEKLRYFHEMREYRARIDTQRNRGTPPTVHHGFDDSSSTSMKGTCKTDPESSNNHSSNSGTDVLLTSASSIPVLQQSFRGGRVILPSRQQTTSTKDAVTDLAGALDSDSLEFLLRALSQN